MTNIKTIVAAALLAATAPALAQQHSHAGMSPAMTGHAASPNTVVNAAALTGPGAVIKVNGLICDFCVQALTRTFRKQAAIRAVAVDLNVKEVRLGFKPGMNIDDVTIGKLIKDAGYNVVTIKRRAA
jgi:copper chaperone CopZ